MYNLQSAKDTLNKFLEYKKHYKTRSSKVYLELRNKLVEEHYPLVVKIASCFSRNGIFNDLVQEGKIGLIKALDYYNKKKGELSTYATYWIKHKILNFMKNDDLIRKPLDVMTYCCKLMRDPRYSRNISSLNNKDIKKALCIKHKNDIERVRNGLETLFVSSLDAPIDDEGSTVYDIVGKEDISLEKDKIWEYERYLSELDERERMIIKMRYMTWNNKIKRKNIGRNIQGYTLAEIGKILGISRERVRQIERKALKKLRIIKTKEEDNKKA